jgi:hypothetical protein
MAVADSGIGSMFDAAASTDVTPSVDSGVDAASAEVETDVTGGEVEAEEGGESSEGAEAGGEENADGTEEGKGKQNATQKDALDDPKSKTPVAVRKQLKEWRDSVQDKNSPEGKAALAAVKTLHESYERYRSITQDLGIKGGFAEIKSMKEFVTNNGGSVAEVQSRFDAIAAVDAKLYGSADDPQQAASLVEDILSDLKAEGREAAMGNLASAFLQGGEAFAKVAVPVIARGLTESGAVNALNDAWRALNAGNTEQAKAALKGLGAWAKDMLDRSQGQKDEPISAEAKKLAEDKAKFTAEREKVARTEVGKLASSDTARILGGSLKPLLTHPFVKGLSTPAKQHLGEEILKEFHSYCASDKSLQSRYTALWSTLKRNPNDGATREKLLSLNQEAATNFAAQSRGLKIKEIVGRIYPQILKPMNAAQGRIAAAKAKEAQASKAAQSGQPVQVASRPEALIREDVTINGKFYSKAALQTMQITGRGFVKTSDGKGYRLVAWKR